LLALASRLVDSAGRGRASALTRLDGGKNNQVYRVTTDAGHVVVLKHYFSDPRDRLAAEWGFLRIASRAACAPFQSRLPAIPPRRPASTDSCRDENFSPLNSSRNTSMPRSPVFRRTERTMNRG
jgi:hypothetical protein